MLALVGYTIGLCIKSMAVEDFAHVEIIVLIVAARQRCKTTENMYSCLLNRLPW